MADDRLAEAQQWRELSEATPDQQAQQLQHIFQQRANAKPETSAQQWLDRAVAADEEEQRAEAVELALLAMGLEAGAQRLDGRHTDATARQRVARELQDLHQQFDQADEGANKSTNDQVGSDAGHRSRLKAQNYNSVCNNYMIVVSVTKL